MNFISRSILMKLLAVCGVCTILFLATILFSLWLTPDFYLRIALIGAVGGIAFVALVITVSKVLLGPIKEVVGALDRLANCNFAAERNSARPTKAEEQTPIFIQTNSCG